MKISPISINNGFFLGIILITFTIVLSYTNPTMFLNSKPMLLSMPFIIILIKAANDFRRKNSGIATFGQLFNITFWCGVVAVTMCSIFEFTLFNYINPSLTDLEMQINLDALEQSKSIFGDDFVEKQKTEIRKGGMHSISASLSTLVIRFLSPTAIFSLIVSFILKRKAIKPIQNKNK